MKRDIFNLTTNFMDMHYEPTEVQVQDSSKDELLKENGYLRKDVNKFKN